MKFDIHCVVFGIVFSKLVKQYYKTNTPTFNTKTVLKNIKKEYKAMILRTPSLTKDNNMADNLKGAAYFFSMARIIPDMTPEKLDEIIAFMFNTDFMAKFYEKERKTGKMFSSKAQDKMYKDSLRSQKSNDEMDWNYTYIKGENEIRYDIHKCGVRRLAEKENLMDYLPCMCKMDYPKYKLRGATLKRDKTLANGDDVCDFHLIKDK